MKSLLLVGLMFVSLSTFANSKVQNCFQIEGQDYGVFHLKLAPRSDFYQQQQVSRRLLSLGFEIRQRESLTQEMIVRRYPHARKLSAFQEQSTLEFFESMVRDHYLVWAECVDPL